MTSEELRSLGPTNSEAADVANDLAKKLEGHRGEVAILALLLLITQSIELSVSQVEPQPMPGYVSRLRDAVNETIGCVALENAQADSDKPRIN